MKQNTDIIKHHPRRFAMLLTGLLCWMPAFAFAQDRDIALTVYTDGLGFVRETRSLELERGRQRATLAGIAPQIDPTSVRARSLTAPNRVSVLEQRFSYDLINSDAVLLRYKNRDIELVLTGSDMLVGGRLLSLDGGITLRREDGAIDIIRRDAVQRFRLPDLPDGLITAPTLEWLIDNTGAPGSHRMEIGYLTEGLSWHAEYAAVINADENGMTLSGWTSIDNRSGMTYDDVALTLVAGEVHRTPQPRTTVRGRIGAGGMAMAEAAPQFDQQQIFEYHTYTLDRRATIDDNAVVQLAMLTDTAVQAVKLYVYDGARMRTTVQARLKFENRARYGLGMPLPRGTVRLYQEDKDGARRFIGEDTIKDLAQDETAYLTVGNAFDIAGERTQTDVRQMSNRSREERYRIVLRNHKQEAVTVKVVEHLSMPSWTLREASHAYERQDASTIEFEAPVSADGEAEMSYSVVYQW